MQTNDAPRITLLELAMRILALPPEQQAQEAYYNMTDHDGFDSCEPVFGIEIGDGGNALLEGVNHS